MRRAYDAYFTPEAATRELLKHVLIDGAVIEPCSGDNGIARVLAETSLVITNDIDPKRPAVFHEDASDGRWWASLRRPEWVVSNPPFSTAHRILPLAYGYAQVGVAMLLRLSYLEPCEGRAGWLATFPPTKLIVLPRISFTGDGKTDSVTCAWMVWYKNAALACVPQEIVIVPDMADLPGALLPESHQLVAEAD